MFQSDGAVGKEFKADGSMGSTAQSGKFAFGFAFALTSRHSSRTFTLTRVLSDVRVVGGPFDKEGAIGKKYVYILNSVG